LRAAFLREAILVGGGFGRDFGGSRLRYIAELLDFGPEDQWVDLVNVTTLPSVVTAQT